MGTFFQTRERLEISGMMPERALLRLKRAEIDLYDVEKPQKDKIRLTVKKRDIEKVFAIYPKVCYNENGHTAYTVRLLGRMGIGKYLDFAAKRVGFVLGLCLFCAATAYADGLVYGVEFSASSVYAREAYAVLEEYGIKPFSRYRAGNEDLICSKLLALNGVEFCSVKKSGGRVVVEMRLGETPYALPLRGNMQAGHTGTVLSIATLKGTALKKAGDSVTAGEMLVGAWIERTDGERRETDVIARASIACTYESVVAAEDEIQAFAIAYLQAGIADGDEVRERSVTACADGYAVKIAYTTIESMNF